MIFYLTFNDIPSGIFSSQVIDVVNFLNTEFKTNTKLVSFISLRGYFKSRKKIKSELPEAIVLPMFPGVHRWHFNSFFLFLLIVFYKPHTIIARSVLATQLALIAKRKRKIIKVVYDGRAAVKAECEEYKVISNLKLSNSIAELEQQCVLQSDYRIAVSNKLVQYWQREFNYVGENHSVIPCTINSLHESIEVNQQAIAYKRKLLGFTSSDIVFVYSGSLAGWQSINLMFDVIKTILSKGVNFKMLFLTEEVDSIKKLQLEFPSQVKCILLKPNQVPNYLTACDFGLLIREDSITNQVASPVKFAEYLACGLKVIISDKIGDFSNLVVQNNLGFIFNQTDLNLIPISLNEKKQLSLSSIKIFKKSNYIKEYQKIINLS